MKPTRHADARVSHWASSVNLAHASVTRITEFEVVSGAYGCARPDLREDFLKRWRQAVQGLEMLDLDSHATLLGSVFRGKRKLAGRPVAFADCAIAGIALSTGSALATRNVRDFEGSGIEVINPFSD